LLAARHENKIGTLLGYPLPARLSAQCTATIFECSSASKRFVALIQLSKFALCTVLRAGVISITENVVSTSHEVTQFLLASAQNGFARRQCADRHQDAIGISRLPGG